MGISPHVTRTRERQWYLRLTTGNFKRVKYSGFKTGVANWASFEKQGFPAEGIIECLDETIVPQKYDIYGAASWYSDAVYSFGAFCGRNSQTVTYGARNYGEVQAKT